MSFNGSRKMVKAFSHSQWTLFISGFDEYLIEEKN